MLTVSASRFKKDFGNYQRLVRRDPVQVINHQETTGYFISPEDFAEFQRLKAAESRRHLRPADLSAQARQALRDAQVPAEFDALNALMQD